MSKIESWWSDLVAELDRHWIKYALLAWFIVSLWYVISSWPQIRSLGLGDTEADHLPQHAAVAYRRKSCRCFPRHPLRPKAIAPGTKRPKRKSLS